MERRRDARSRRRPRLSAGLAASALSIALSAIGAAGCAVGEDADPRGGDGGARGDAASAGECTSGSRCGDRCVDIASDPAHCGGCDRTCVIPGAVAACVAGACAIDRCELGRHDCNGVADDGCEVGAECREGAACTTACGTQGSLSCADACAPACAPPAEACNLIDDDCDGACESGLPGCRRAVHRSNGPSGHFYTTDEGEAGCCGMTIESRSYFYLLAGAVDGTQPFFRCLAGDGHHFYTTDTGCDAAGAYEGQMGFVAREPRCGSVPLHRLRHANGDHFYTTSDGERDYAVTLGYAYVGVIGHVWTSP